jgi:protein required for attachment to host cells
MKSESWLILANAGCMKVFRFQSNTRKLTQSETTLFPECHLRPHDVNTDRSGHSTNRAGHGGNSYEPRKDFKKVEEEHFAKQVSHFLNQAAENKEFERLYLAISKEFWGVLKTYLSPKVFEKVSEEIHKDLTHEHLDSIWSHFPSMKK